MTRVEAKCNKLIKLLQNIPAVEMLSRITAQNAHIIEDKNIAQLDAGIDGDGNKIEPAYTPFTVKIKKLKGQPFDRVTLQDEKDFVKGIKAEPFVQGVKLHGTEKKTDMLEEKYGSAVIKLTEQSKSEIREEVYFPEMQLELKNYFANG